MKTLIARAFALAFLVTIALHAQVPRMINDQGRGIVGTTNFTGTGQSRPCSGSPR